MSRQKRSWETIKESRANIKREARMDTPVELETDDLSIKLGYLQQDTPQFVDVAFKVPGGYEVARVMKSRLRLYQEMQP